MARQSSLVNLMAIRVLVAEGLPWEQHSQPIVAPRQGIYYCGLTNVPQPG